MGTSEKLTTSATTYPVSVIEARKHLRVDINEDDIEIYNLIRRATAYATGYTGRAFIDEVWTQYRDDGFSGEMMLAHLPVVSVDSIKYLDADGTQQTLATTVYRTDLITGRITLAHAQTWPSVRAVTNTVEIAYTAGYGTSQSPVGLVPEDIKHGILLLVGHWLENKEAVTKGTTSKETPIGVHNLLDQVRVYHV